MLLCISMRVYYSFYVDYGTFGKKLEQFIRSRIFKFLEEFWKLEEPVSEESVFIFVF